jgi:hypothetical protein
VSVLSVASVLFADQGALISEVTSTTRCPRDLYNPTACKLKCRKGLCNLKVTPGWGSMLVFGQFGLGGPEALPIICPPLDPRRATRKELP